MTLTREVLREFLATKTRANFDNVGDDDELFSTGLIDSFAMVELLGFLEQHTGSRLGPEDIDIDNLDSVNRILAFGAAQAQG
ncbi:MAG: phosphopantetheine-binding protein [Myxococcota bacterium]